MSFPNFRAKKDEISFLTADPVWSQYCQTKVTLIIPLSNHGIIEQHSRYLHIKFVSCFFFAWWRLVFLIIRRRVGLKNLTIYIFFYFLLINRFLQYRLWSSLIATKLCVRKKSGFGFMSVCILEIFEINNQFLSFLLCKDQNATRKQNRFRYSLFSKISIFDLL